LTEVQVGQPSALQSKLDWSSRKLGH